MHRVAAFCIYAGDAIGRNFWGPWLSHQTLQEDPTNKRHSSILRFFKQMTPNRKFLENPF